MLPGGGPEDLTVDAQWTLNGRSMDATMDAQWTLSFHCVISKTVFKNCFHVNTYLYTVFEITQ